MGFGSIVEKVLKPLELPERTDVYTWKGTTRWGNHDLYPIPEKERTFGYLGFFSSNLVAWDFGEGTGNGTDEVAVWVMLGVSIGTFTLGSSYIAYGLSAGEVIGGVFVGSLISSWIAFFCARPGMDYHTGYAIYNRSVFGLWGNTLPIGVVFLGGLVFAGMQSYYGGMALAVMISAIIPQFKDMPNTLPASAAITPQNLIGFVLYSLIFLCIIYVVPPHKIRKCLYPAFAVVSVTFIGLLAWALSSNHGPGNLISSALHLSKSQRAFRMVQCISSISGSYGGAADRISDWTRFEKRRGVSTPAMLLVLPICVTISATFGVLTTTATYHMYGKVLWNPLTLLQYIQETNYTPATRAGTFFAGTGLLCTQIFMNLSQNVMTYGMDLAGLFPRYVSMKRGAMGVVIVCMAIQPWRFVSQAAIFVTILSCFTIFHASQTTMIVADYWLLRKKKWVVPDLFTPNGIYWFYHGWNLRCIAAMIIGMAPCIPGFIFICINSKTDNAWVKIYQITWFVAAPLSLCVYMGLNYVFPPEGLGRMELLPDGEESEVVEGVEVGKEGGVVSTKDKDREAQVGQTSSSASSSI